MTVEPQTLKKTALWETHQKLGARLVPFAGYDMPVQYKGVIEEHQCVREHVGLFDVSHMGIAQLAGQQAGEFLEFALTRDLSKLEPGKAAYSLLCKEDGGTLDDLIVYQESKDLFWIVFNASNKDKDFYHLRELKRAEGFNCEIRAFFDQMSLLALQGPASEKVLKNLGFRGEWPKPFSFLNGQLGPREIPVKLAFTGYTGEKGCEIFVKSSQAVELWNEIMKAGVSERLQPIGLAARDTLRTEMGYSLYGHELSEDINPVEAGLNWAIGFKKSRFMGREALLAARDKPGRKLVCLKTTTKQAPRQGMKVFDSRDQEVGQISSGTYGPSLGYAIGMALVDAAAQAPFFVEIRERKIPFELTERPFYKPKNKS